MTHSASPAATAARAEQAEPAQADAALAADAAGHDVRDEDVRDEVEGLDAELRRLREELAETRRQMGELRRRATFPEQNPNLVIELDRVGQVTYINPEAGSQMPDLAAQGARHPLLDPYHEVLARFSAGETEPIVCEATAAGRVFEQKWCPTYADEQLVVRLFAHDVTDRTRAEQAIQQLARRVVTAQEEERHRVSRELHDEAGQALTALKISLQLILDELPASAAGAAADLEKAVALVDTTREGIRALARGLRPPALDAVGLNLGLEDACRTLAEHTGLSISYRGDPDADGLPDAVSVCLYRLLQEALANAARHAEARRVSVRLSREADGVRLVVKDDGLGFDAAATTRGLGLKGMAERLDLLGGTLTVKTHRSQGTRVEGWVPLGESP
jgi:signal transduction histidine kinase